MRRDPAQRAIDPIAAIATRTSRDWQLDKADGYGARGVSRARHLALRGSVAAMRSGEEARPTKGVPAAAVSLLTVVCLCSCSSTPAPASAPEPQPALRGPMQMLSFYVGDWSCTGKQFATPDSKEETWTARVQVRPEVGGGAVSVHMIGPDSNLTAELKGYDTAKKKWFHLWVNHEGAWGSFSSAAFDGDRMVSVNDDPATGGKERAVFSKLGETRYSHRVEADQGNGFQPVWEKVCNKTGDDK
jgi:hypothetical protein